MDCQVFILFIINKAIYSQPEGLPFRSLKNPKEREERNTNEVLINIDECAVQQRVLPKKIYSQQKKLYLDFL
ncbi:hypothetical protein Fmac_008011 [Flemingia macrophylla]|uniref:Uncharacterized protein n=1 Tax=Flemingia macrophylla TaxID=520843 RepID=A0ABD1MW96_9FABA